MGDTSEGEMAETSDEPCPWCGQEPRTFEFAGKRLAGCKNRSCPMSSLAAMDRGDWNTRAPDPRLTAPEMVEEMARALINADAPGIGAMWPWSDRPEDEEHRESARFAASAVLDAILERLGVRR